MPLTTGDRLGPYEILAPLGAGGMGEVYRARDTRLERDVALKILPTHLASDPHFRERFDREAKSIAALSHPNICILFDVGDCDLPREAGATGSTHAQFLVMEHLEGETLADRLSRGALPVQEALDVSIQIGDALHSAHRVGIVHRDLKPGNVMLTKGDAARQGRRQAKLLDFGLAKATGSRPASATAVAEAFTTADRTAAVTQQPLTAQGTILGTFQYMSPEQIEGGDADARSDIFAFGVVMYEMLTGRRAFQGKTTAGLAAAILGAEPPALALAQPLTPPALQRLVGRCLEKDPDNRWQTMRDLLAALKWIEEDLATGRTAQAVPAASGPRRIGWAAAALAAVAAAAGGTWWLTRAAPAPPRPVVRFSVQVDDPGLSSSIIAFSPDGTKLVYAVGTTASDRQLHLRSLDELEAAPVRGTEGASSPFFSPDGSWIGFFAGGQLRKVSVSGGVSLALGAADAAGGGAWSADETIFFFPPGSSLPTSYGLQRVSSAGGSPLSVTTIDRQVEATERSPDALPNGRGVLFTAVRRGVADLNTSGAIALVRLDTGEQRTLIESGFSPRYAPSGHIVFARAGTLFAAPFDLDRLEVTGPEVPVVEGVLTNPVTGAAAFTISATGALAYVPGREELSSRSLVWVDRRGVETPIAGRPSVYQELDLSPDGSRVVVNVGVNQLAGGSGTGDVWIHELARGTLSRFTFGPTSNETPVWSPDGSEIAYAGQQSGDTRVVFVKPADGRPERKVGEKGGHFHVTSWSPRDQVLAIAETGSGVGGGDIWLLHMADQKFEPLFRTAFNERSPVFSPDGRWLAYVTNESGQDEVYVQAFPGPGGRSQISTEGGVTPVWAPNGREIFYRNRDKMMAVPVEASGQSLQAGAPVQLFEKRYLYSTGDQYYDVSPDGQRFVMLKQETGSEARSIVVVQEWTQELERFAPAKR